MTDILATKNGKTYFISTNKGEVYLAEQKIDQSGFITYEDIYYHNLTLQDVHQISRYGGNKEYKLVKNISKETLPLHTTEEKP